jgi:hypothetical protein
MTEDARVGVKSKELKQVQGLLKRKQSSHIGMA